MSNEDIIRENQEIDMMVFGKTNLNYDGNIDVGNTDILEKLEEIQTEINHFKEEVRSLLEDLKDKLRALDQK